jgi:hypothetical protein
MEFALNTNMGSNLQTYKAIIKHELEQGQRGTFACLSLDRDPSKDFGSWVHVDGMVDTFLHTCNEHL